MSIRQTLITNGRRRASGFAQVLARSINHTRATGVTNAYCVFASGGGYTQIPTNDYTWRLSGVSASYDIRYVRKSGTETVLAGGLANNTWYNLNTSRTMYLAVTTQGLYKTLVADVSIKWNANSTIISTAQVDWYSEYLY